MSCDSVGLWQAIDAAAGQEVPVVLVDGGSGSGKTTLARALVAARAGAQLVSLDACYPGWQGLAAGSRMVVTDILGRTAGYWRWDWEHGRRGDWISLDPARPRVVEGCGALTVAARRLAHFGIWCELDDDTRRSRALARDGASYEPHWELWRQQELRHWAEHRPAALADIVCRG